MRRRSADPDVWGELYDRFRGPGGAPGGRPPWLGMPPDSRARLLDAALGVVGSLRVLVDVAEEVLTDHRDRLGSPATDPVRPARPGPAPRPGPNGAVQDIPMEG